MIFLAYKYKIYFYAVKMKLLVKKR